jgi:hypothetical protein
MNRLQEEFAEIYENWQLLPYPWVNLCLVVIAMVVGYWISRLFLRKAIYRRTFSSISQDTWVPIVHESKILHTLSLLTPLSLFGMATRYYRAVLPPDRDLIILNALSPLIQGLAILLFFVSMGKLIGILGAIYRNTKAAQKRPIKSYVIFVRWFISSIAAIIMVWSSPKKVDMDRTDRSVSLGGFSEFESVD